MSSNSAAVTIEINQQQAQMLERIIADGDHGSTYGDVIRSGFVHFCTAHPEFLSGAKPNDPDRQA